MARQTGQSWDPERYDRNVRFVSDLGAPVVALLAPQPGERILDLGCGDGVLTQALVAAGAEVVGIDASPELIAAARERGLDASVGDGQALEFEAEFDAVFSNAALHWMTDPDAVLDGIKRALKPGGRFVAEMGGFANVAAAVVALTAALEARGIDGRQGNPWYFPSADEYRHKLEARGFGVEDIALIARPTPLPGHLSGWLETFAESFFQLVDASERRAMEADVVRLLAPVLCDGEGKWTVDYVRLRFRAWAP